MAYVVPTNVATGDVLTASTWNQAVVENSRKLRGDWAQARRTSGNWTLNNTAWQNLDTGLDLTLAADSGDVIEAAVSAFWGSENVDGFLDVVTLVSSTPTNSFATGGAIDANSQGVQAWRGQGNMFLPVGGSSWLKLVSGDISSSTVTLRLRYRTGAASNKTLYAPDNALHFVFTARNHGPVEV